MGKTSKNNNKPKDQHSNRLVYGIIFLFSFLLYGQTISYDYTLDDTIVIKSNNFTREGIQGIPDLLQYDTFTGFFGIQKKLVAGGRYRPLSLITFAIEYELFGLNPGISHFINILLYGLTGVLLYRILLMLLVRFQSKRWYYSIPFITTMLFLAHPLHTEVVANIKGRDEIMTFLGSLWALFLSLKYLQNPRIKYLIYSFIAFFLGLLSKENTITFLAVIPFAVYFFSETKFRQIAIITIPLLLASAIFLLIRQSILGDFSAPVARELMNNPFLDASISEKFATIFYTLGLYLKLIFFPHPLTYDYYPKHIPILSWGDFGAWFSLFLYVAMGAFALWGLKKKSLPAFAIWFYLATLSVVSNLVFPVGTFMNERFVYISSLAFSLVVGWALVEKLPLWIPNQSRYLKTLPIILGVLLLSYSLKTWTRNPAWENDFTLFTTDVETSVNSAKGNAAVASKYREAAEIPGILPAERDKNYRKAIEHWDKALTIHPKYYDVALDLGLTQFKYDQNIEKTIAYLKKAYQINPDNTKGYQFYSAILKDMENPQVKLNFYLEYNEAFPKRYYVLYEIGSTYGRDLNDLDQAIQFLLEATQVKPKGSEAWKDLGVAYGFKGDYEKAIAHSKKALELKPDDAQTCVNIALTYRNLGNETEAAKYFKRAAEIDPKYKDLQP